MTNIVNAAAKPKGDEERGEYESETRTARGVKKFTKTGDRFKPFLKITSVVHKRKKKGTPICEVL
jgi:hypothetical protein